MLSGKQNKKQASLKQEDVDKNTSQSDCAKKEEDIKVADWSKESNQLNDNKVESENEQGSQVHTEEPKKKSILDFDRDEVSLLEHKKVSDLNLNDLLKVLIRRGEVNQNPVLGGGCKRLLKQINSERFDKTKKPPRSRHFYSDKHQSPHLYKKGYKKHTNRQEKDDRYHNQRGGYQVAPAQGENN